MLCSSSPFQSHVSSLPGTSEGQNIQESGDARCTMSHPRMAAFSLCMGVCSHSWPHLWLELRCQNWQLREHLVCLLPLSKKKSHRAGLANGVGEATWQRSHPYQHQVVLASQSFASSLFVMLKINEWLKVRWGEEPWLSGGGVWPHHLPAKQFSKTTSETDVPSHLSSPQFPSRTRSGQLNFHPRAGYRRGA